MDKYYLIDLRDLDGLFLLEDVDIYLKYNYVKIIVREDSSLDKILSEKCKTFTYPYCIRFSAADKADDTKIYFQGMKDDSLKEVIEYKFRQMLDYREIYLHKRDYDFIKEKIEIYN